MNLVSLMEISKIVYGSDDLFCMFQEYELDKRLDRDLLNKRLLSYLGASTPLYTTCKTFKGFLEAFFLDHSDQITKLVDTLYFEYNPIWNKDGTEKRTITTSRKTTHERESENADTTHHTGTDTTKHTGTDTTRHTGTDTTNHTGTDTTRHTGTDTTTDTGTNTGSVSADNVSTWQNDTRTATDNTNTRTANLSDARTADLSDTRTADLSDTRTADLSDTRTANLSDTRTANLTDATTGTTNESGTQTETETVTDEFVTQGNIGITSTQQLITEQRALMEFDIYDWILQKLKVDMFLLVY